MKINAICARCSCLCDDITLEVIDGQITRAEHACALGEAWFKQPPPQANISAQIDGRPVAIEPALAEAAQLLKAARAPIILGMAAHTSETQQQAVALADVLGAYIDSGTSAQTDMAFAQYGISTTTLGEVRKRADVVVCLGADPASTHPRFFERYAALDTRELIVVDTQRTASANLAASFIELAPSNFLDGLSALRAIAKGKPVAPIEARFAPEEIGALQSLMDRLKRSRYALIVLGSAYQTRERGQFVAEALAQLVAELNQFTRCTILHLPTDHGVGSTGIANAVGAANVLAWQTGYSQAVGFGRGYPVSNGGEYSAENLLARGEVDAALWLADGGLPQLSSPALAHWQRIPKVVLASTALSHAVQPRVSLPTAHSGLQAGGTAYRLDGVSLHVRPHSRSQLPSQLPSPERLLADLYQHLCPQPTLT